MRPLFVKDYRQNPQRFVPQSFGTKRRPRFRRWGCLAIAGLLGAGVIVGAPWYVQRGTIQGVPVSILLKFLLDPPARTAYFTGQKQALHGRLDQLGIEEDIKTFYRPSIPDEVELDRYIHQLMYDRTGYVGKSYKVGPNARLQLKSPTDRQFPRWFNLAVRAGLVLGSEERSGVWYVKTATGELVPYTMMAELFPIQSLQELIRTTSPKPK